MIVTEECMGKEGFRQLQCRGGCAKRLFYGIPVLDTRTPLHLPQSEGIGLVGFEPTASWSRTRRSTKLRYSPKYLVVECVTTIFQPPGFLHCHCFMILYKIPFMHSSDIWTKNKALARWVSIVTTPSRPVLSHACSDRRQALPARSSGRMISAYAKRKLSEIEQDLRAHGPHQGQQKFRCGTGRLRGDVDRVQPSAVRRDKHAADMRR